MTTFNEFTYEEAWKMATKMHEQGYITEIYKGSESKRWMVQIIGTRNNSRKKDIHTT